jgi:hypothetical protein
MSLPDGLRGLAWRLAGRDVSAEDERLLELFRNRTELKRELDALDEERHQLLDRLKLQEGATMRVQEQLDALEQFLGRPEEGYRCLAHFRLRGVWRTAARRVQHFAADLTRQQKDRERRQQLAAFERSQRDRLAQLDRELAEANVLADQLQAEQKLARQRLSELRGFWKLLQRRRLEDEVANRAVRVDAALTELTDLSDRRHAIESEGPPPFEGLSLEGKRAVNLAVIAFAENLYERLADSGVAQLARQSMLTRVYDCDYGSGDDCLAVMKAAEHAARDLERLQEDLPDIKARADRMRRTASYRGDGEALPVAESLVPSPQGGSRPPLNVLLEEYWEVHRALQR